MAGAFQETTMSKSFVLVVLGCARACTRAPIGIQFEELGGMTWYDA